MLETIVGTMNAARLQFAVQFAQMDLDTLRPGDWMNLRWDLDLFLHLEGKDRPRELITKLRSGIQPDASHGGIITAALVGPSPLDMPESDIKALQADARDLLTDVVTTRVPPQKAPFRFGIHADLAILGATRAAGRAGRNLGVMKGTVRDTFRLVLWLLLIQEPTDRVLRCPECGKLFYRVRKQAYCSRPCVNRATVRKWRATEEGKQQDRERAAAHYRKRKAPARVQPRSPRRTE
jgi:phage FluMu protein Com